MKTPCRPHPASSQKNSPGLGEAQQSGATSCAADHHRPSALLRVSESSRDEVRAKQMDGLTYAMRFAFPSVAKETTCVSPAVGLEASSLMSAIVSSRSISSTSWLTIPSGW